MGKTQEYKPQFPKSHAHLLAVYESLIQARSEEEIATRVDRFKGFTNALERLNEDGALSVGFVRGFHLDVQDVLLRVHAELLDANRLTQQQNEQYFYLRNFHERFGRG